MRRSLVRRLGAVGPLALATAALPPLGSLLLYGTVHLTAPWLKAHGEAGVALFTAALAALGGVALLPTYAPALIGGWAFGIGLGLVATTAGFAGAAVIGHAIARRASGDQLLAVLREHPRGEAVRQAFLTSGFWRAALVVALLRLPPNAPFAMTNLLLAAASVPFGAYLAGTVTGLLPRAGAAVVIGASLSTLRFDDPQHVWLSAFGIAATICAAATLGWLARRAVLRMDSGRVGRTLAPAP